MCNANSCAHQTLCTHWTLRGSSLILDKLTRHTEPSACPQQIKLILNYTATLLFKKTKPTGHRPYHNMCYKSSRISCASKAKCWTWLHFILWGMEEEGRAYCNKGEKELETTNKSPCPHHHPPRVEGKQPISKLSRVPVLQTA